MPPQNDIKKVPWSDLFQSAIISQYYALMAPIFLINSSSFLDCCFQSNQDFRPSAAALLEHPFLLQPEPDSAQLLAKMEVVFLGSSLKMSGLLMS